MAVPASGELKLWDTLWNQELAGTKGENSLHSASVYAGFSTPDALSDFYGWSDVEVPSVTTLGATSVTNTSAILRGCVTDTGNEDVTSGFYFGNSNTSTSNPKYTLPGTRGTGIYCCSKTGLSAQTRYYVWAYACNSAGECIANNKCTIATPAPPFTVQSVNWYNHTRSEVQPNFTNCPKAVYASHYYVNPYTSGLGTFWSRSVNGPNIIFFCSNNRQASCNSNSRFCSCSCTSGFEFQGLIEHNSKLTACRAEGYCWKNLYGAPVSSRVTGISLQGGNDNRCTQMGCEVIQFQQRCTEYTNPNTNQSLSVSFTFPDANTVVSDIRLKTNISYL